MSMPVEAKPILDGSFLAITISAFVDIIPSITALVSLIWVCIRIYETRTVQKLIHRHKPMDRE